MNMGHNKSRITQLVAIPFFMLAAISVTLATWLFKEGRIPRVRLAPGVHIGFGDGSALSVLFFFVLVTTLYVASVALFFAGYRLWKARP
jgi:hypothetical protein